MAKLTEMLRLKLITGNDEMARRIGMSADQAPATVTTIGGCSYV
jgi:hypothetical protein